MGLQTIKIVKEEFKKLRQDLNNLKPAAVRDLEAAIINRIEQECIEIPEEEFCCFCGETEADCCGGGGPLAYDPHDFTKGGISKAEADADHCLDCGQHKGNCEAPRDDKPSF